MGEGTGYWGNISECVTLQVSVNILRKSPGGEEGILESAVCVVACVEKGSLTGSDSPGWLTLTDSHTYAHCQIHRTWKKRPRL